MNIPGTKRAGEGSLCQHTTSLLSPGLFPIFLLNAKLNILQEHLQGNFNFSTLTVINSLPVE